ncbi:MAG: hypothetical protein J6W79_02810, partial [Alphaproteobacteria bacterium]|nr:hypothetical protein [Alphaproteobacteria bacterium]
LRKRGYDPIVYRYFVTLGHFQSQLAFSWDAMDAATNGYKNIVRRVADIIANKSGDLDKDVYDTWHDKLLAPTSDNLKTAETLVVFQELLRDNSVNNTTKVALVEFIDRLLGLLFIEHAEKLIAAESESAPAEIVALAEQRTAAKASKDWATADALRDQIDAAGWVLTDTPTGPKLIKKA